jgi:hypothetical protein
MIINHAEARRRGGMKTGMNRIDRMLMGKQADELQAIAGGTADERR